MVYSLAGILAIAIHFIVNIDVFLNFRKKKRFSGERFYLLFLLSVIAFHISDGFWGILYDKHLADAVFADTTIYFIAMALSILFWSFFVYFYLGIKKKIILYLSGAVFLLQIIPVIVNFFTPVLFKVTSDCVYSASYMRYATLAIQVLMFLLLAISTFIMSLRQDKMSRHRHYAIMFFSLFMLAAVMLQVFFPLMPMYSLGYLFGVCILHTFVVEDEKANQRIELEEAQYQVSIDPLTGVKSKHAYIDIEAEIDVRINKNEMEPFAFVVFDLNDLKKTNDTMGHEAGDEYIIASTNLIGEYFSNVDIYRVGGDEFAILLFKEEYDNREAMFNSFNELMEQNNINGEVIVISAGMSIYDPDKDNTAMRVYTRADSAMYERKRYLKEQRGEN